MHFARKWALKARFRTIVRLGGKAPFIVLPLASQTPVTGVTGSKLCESTPASVGKGSPYVVQRPQRHCTDETVALYTPCHCRAM